MFQRKYNIDVGLKKNLLPCQQLNLVAQASDSIDSDNSDSSAGVRVQGSSMDKYTRLFVPNFTPGYLGS